MGRDGRVESRAERDCNIFLVSFSLEVNTRWALVVTTD
jgi:hypothetical protein